MISQATLDTFPVLVPLTRAEQAQQRIAAYVASLVVEVWAQGTPQYVMYHKEMTNPRITDWTPKAAILQAMVNERTGGLAIRVWRRP